MESGAALSDRLRRDVEELSAIERRAGTDGDRRSADWVVARLRELGAEDVRVEAFRCHSTWAIPYAAHQLLGMLAALLPAPLRVPLALAAAASYEADYIGRDQTLRSLVPGAREGHTVVGRIRAAGEPLRTLVLVAHHDAAHTGWVWDPRFLAGGRSHARRTGTTPSFIALPLAALAMVAAGVRRTGAALLGLALGLGVQAALSETVPGASDNASGVAGLLELARRYAAEPLPETDVLLVFPSGEEVGLAGMYAWLRAGGGRELDRDSTLVLGLDTLGAGEPVVARGESIAGSYRDADLALAGPDVARVRLGAGTDPMAARHAGLRAVSILSWRDGGFRDYHLPTDTPERIDWDSVAACVRLAGAIVEAWRRS